MNQGLLGWPGSELLVLFPGIIVDYYGDASLIRTPWALCDGSNGTPDLRDKFIVGAGGSYALGATGGATDQSYTPSGTIEQAAFTGAPLGTHDHTFADTSTVAGAHTHTYSAATSTPSGTGTADLSAPGSDGYATDTHTHTAAGSTDSAGDHTHDVSGDTSAVSAGTPAGTINAQTFTGDNVDIATLPPYVGLYKIMYLGFGTA